MVPVYRPDRAGMTENEIGKVVVGLGLYSSHEVALSADRQGRTQRVKAIVFCFIF